MSITLEEDRLANELFYEAILSDNMEKVGEGVINDYVRLKLREDGVARRELPPVKIGDTELDRQYDTSLPAKVVDMEIDSPAAITAHFAQNPDQCYIRGQRFRVTFARILSPWFAADVNELRTHVMDIRQVMSDNSLKDMLAEEDAGFFGMVQTAMVGSGTVGTTGPFSGVVQWQAINGAINRNGVKSTLQIMPSMDGHLHVEKCILNNVTVFELYNWGRDEMGGDLSEDVVRNGWTIREFMGVKEWIVSIKRNLIPNNTIFQFGNTQFQGKFYELDETTMYIERKAYMLSWFNYECLGMTWANPYSVTRTDFTG